MSVIGSRESALIDWSVVNFRVRAFLLTVGNLTMHTDDRMDRCGVRLESRVWRRWEVYADEMIVKFVLELF